MPTDQLAPPVPTELATQTLDDPALYLNRALSWLQFPWRVLDEALQQRAPMLALLEQNLVLTQRVGALSQRMQTLTAEVYQRLVVHET